MDKDVLEVFVLSLPSKLGHEKVAMSTAASVAKLMGFSEDRIEDLKTAVAEASLDHIWTTLEAFATEPEQRDDMTALVLLRNG